MAALCLCPPSVEVNMLPDLKALKRDLLDFHLREVARQAHALLGIFNEIPRYRVSEGKRMRVDRADGTDEESSFETASAEIHIPVAQVPNMTADERSRILEGLAVRLAAQMNNQLFAALDSTLERAGQVVDGGGKPLNGEMLIEILSKLAMDFDDNGEIKNQVFIGDPTSLVRAYEEINSNPELRARHAALMAEKKERWRDRESARALVG